MAAPPKPSNTATIPTTLWSAEAEMSVLGGILIDDAGGARTKAFSLVTEEMFHIPRNRVLFKALKEMWEKGTAIDPITLGDHLDRSKSLLQVGGFPYVAQLLDAVPSAANIEYHCKIVKEKAALRTLRDISFGVIRAAESGKYDPQPVMDRLMTRIMEVGVTYDTAGSKLMTPEEIMAGEEERMNRDPSDIWNADLPWERVNEHLVGGFIPGDVVLVPGYSNAGKTLLVANIVRHWATRRFYQKWFPTESAERFFSRVASVHAQTPQVYPERDAWHLASEEEKEAYRFAKQDLYDLGRWSLHTRLKVTVEEIIAHSEQYRRTIPDGEPLIVVVDHLHRLDYGGLRPQMMAGAAIQRLRDWAKDATQRGRPTILVVLAQPRKPDVDVAQYQYVSLYGMAGEGMIAAEADVVISPFRRWSVLDPSEGLTSWGTPAVMIEHGLPKRALPNAPGATLDDQHVFLKFVKRRTQGEGPVSILPIHAPSGFIKTVSEMGARTATGTHD